jgi:glyoxylate reductase
VNLETLLREADFVSLHVPLLPGTRHLIGKRQLDLMKPTACLVNNSRGPVVDEAALAEALAAGRIRGAALDVFENEPEIHPTLLKLENVVLVPHIGSASVETRLKMAMIAVENVVEALHGRKPPNIVNPEVLG